MRAVESVSRSAREVAEGAPGKRKKPEGHCRLTGLWRRAREKCPLVSDTPTGLAKYASQRLLHHLERHPRPPEEPAARTFLGAVMFADMQNFTVLAERLNREDPVRGVKNLADYLDVYIGKLVDLITQHGGDIVKFAGDAVFAVWEEKDGTTLLAALRAAVHCGLEIQTQLHRYEVAPGTQLALRVGVSAGRLHELHLGGHRDRWEFLIAGAAMTACARAATTAEPGEVILAAPAVRILEMSGGVRVPPKRLRIPHILPHEIPPPLQRSDVAPEARAALNVYIPRALLVGNTRLESELRPLTVLFCKVKGIRFSIDASALADVQIVMLIMQECLYRYEGSINRFGVDEKGAVLLAAFGLPPLVHDDDPVRGILAARDIRRALASIGRDASIGVATGRAFCGTVGNETRCEYTMHGVNVNLAARLMVKADTILCDQNTYQAAADRFEFEEQPPMKVKNLEGMVHTYRPRD